MDIYEFLKLASPADLLGMKFCFTYEDSESIFGIIQTFKVYKTKDNSCGRIVIPLPSAISCRHSNGVRLLERQLESSGMGFNMIIEEENLYENRENSLTVSSVEGTLTLLD